MRPQTDEDSDSLVIQTMDIKKSPNGHECHDIEDEEGECKPMRNTAKAQGGELKAGRIHGFRMDRARILNYDDECVELSQGTLRESLHLATIQDPNALRTMDDDICNQKSPSALLNSQREGTLTPVNLTELTPRLPDSLAQPSSKLSPSIPKKNLTVQGRHDLNNILESDYEEDISILIKDYQNEIQ